jgi:enoyl-CoA hydratase
MVSAAELQRLGAVRAVVPRSELDATARELAKTLASKSPLAMRLAKASMNQVEDLPLKEAYRIEQTYTERLVKFEDSAEARAAFFEKREPIWKLR